MAIQLSVFTCPLSIMYRRKLTESAWNSHFSAFNPDARESLMYFSMATLRTGGEEVRTEYLSQVMIFRGNVSQIRGFWVRWLCGDLCWRGGAVCRQDE